MKRILISILVICSYTSHINAQDHSDSTFHRHYEIGIAPSYDLDNVSRNSLTTFKLAQDLYSKGIQPKMPEKLGNILGGVWSFSATYLTGYTMMNWGWHLRIR